MPKHNTAPYAVANLEDVPEWLGRAAPLSGDKAYALFMSNRPDPLRDYLDAWKSGYETAAPSYVLSVIRCYDCMLAQCGDGRYTGKIR